MKWKQGEVRNLIRASRTIHRNPFFQIAMVPLAHEKARLVVVVPKHIGSAPERNRCKRRMRALVRLYIFPYAQCDLIIFIRKSIAHLPASDLQALVIQVVPPMVTELQRISSNPF